MVNELLKECMKRGFLLDKEMLSFFDNLEEKRAKEIIEAIGHLGIKERIITRKVFAENVEKIRRMIVDYNPTDEVENFFSDFTLKKSSEFEEKIETFEDKKGIKLISAPAFIQRKISVNDFIKHFRSRFDLIKGYLEKKDFDDLTSLRKIEQNGSYTVIGAVVNKRVTKNHNIIIEIEDISGVKSLLINKNKPDVYEVAEKVLVDDILAFKISVSGNFIFCNEIIYPDVGLKEKNYSKEDYWIAFTSDIHVGSKMFLEKNFLKFIKWLNSKDKNEIYGDIADKVKYLFIDGDLVDGVSHYPGQEKDLLINTCSGQYKKVAELFKLIRNDIQLVACSGNHDAVWVGEPQPIIGERWAGELNEIENLTLVPNPSLVEVERDFKILMYHGASINAFIEEIPEIRTKYGHDSPTIVVKEMLKRRHLAPMHGLVDYIPCEVDPLVIDKVPDILFTGDIHRCEVSIQNNILLIAGSCWQSITPFMEKVGINPDPCKVILFNAKTREVKILDFSDDENIKWLKDKELMCKLDENFCEVKENNGK